MPVPRVFELPHLSEDAVAACADGVLSESAAARARKHCAECAECAQAVRVQRETAMMLRTATSPTMPAGLMDRLTHLPMSTPLPPPHSGLPTVLGSDGVPMFAAHNPPGRNPPGRNQPGRTPAEPTPADKPQPHGHHRRVLVPVGIFASAAAMVAAGTIGSGASTLQPAGPAQPAAVQPLVTGLTGLTVNQVALTGPEYLPVRRVLATSPRIDRP